MTVDFRFIPIRVKDMYESCVENGLHMITYSQFLHITRTMDKAGYNIISNKQIDQLKKMINDISQ